MSSLCAVIPVYNNVQTIERVVANVQQYIDKIIVVDDGSNDGTQTLLDNLQQQNPDKIQVQHLSSNQGKGAAVQVGFKLAQQRAFTHALQIDADAQHAIEDIPLFIENMESYPEAMIVGDPVFGDDIPAIRKHGRKITKWMVAIESGSLNMPDSMCGYRIYPVNSVCALGAVCTRMGFDPEILVKARWAGMQVVTVPTRIRYLSPEEGGVSHFRMVRDNLINISVHTRLILQTPFRLLLRWAR